MIYCAGYTVSFQEVPDEVSLVLLISECQFRCKGCHSPELQKKTGEELTERFIDDLVDQYRNAITCVCFMGEGANICQTCVLAKYIKEKYKLKTALYTGMTLVNMASTCFNMVTDSFDYFKVGPYIEDLGGLASPDTNQMMFHVEKLENNGISINNITHKFQRKVT